MAYMRILVIALLFMCNSALASIEEKRQPYQLPNTEVRELTSKTNGVTYSLYISLPKGYKKGGDYPVVFTLDADYSFALTHNIIEHLSDRKNLPKMVVVGIGYPGKGQDGAAYRLNRTRDYTPTHVVDGGYGPRFQKHSGGARKFAGFIQNELVPMIRQKYDAGISDRTLVGHSFGGLFASYVLLTRPALFQRFIIVSPSLWYDNKKLFDLQKRHAKRNDSLKAKVFYAVGSEENRTGQPMVDQLTAFYDGLKQSRYKGLKLNKRIFKGENHNSIFPTALTTGLRTVFSR